MLDPKLEAKELRGREAKRLLEEPLLIEAFESVRAGCIAKFAEPLASEQLEELSRLYRSFLKLENYIKHSIREGADAKKLLDAMEKTNQVNGQG